MFGSNKHEKKSRLKEGDRVAYKFRGDSWQSTAEVVRVLDSKEKTDFGDTVTTVHYDVKECETAQTPPGKRVKRVRTLDGDVYGAPKNRRDRKRHQARRAVYQRHNLPGTLATYFPKALALNH